MRLSDPVTVLPKVGGMIQKKLERLEIFKLEDLLYHYPFRYEDSSNTLKISDVINHVGESVALHVKILTITQFRTRYGKIMVQAKIYDDTGHIDAVWFNMSYITNYLKNGTEAIFFGKIYAKGKKLSISSPKYEVVNSEGQTKFLGNISGVYPETYGISSRFFKDKISLILENLSYTKINDDSIIIEDKLDERIRKKYNLEDIISALKLVHLPSTLEDVEKGKERLAFDEILEIQKSVLKAKKLREQLKSTGIKFDKTLLEEFENKSAFTPTIAQLRSVREILTDMEKNTPMNRLLEGDVGSGKTWVAAAASAQALKHGMNVAFLAPTAVLAKQHSESLVKMLSPYGINVVLVTASTRKKLTEDFDESNLFIGTHALLHDERFRKNLGLVIVDEQHRFGVKQREYLLELENENVKTGEKTSPHFLSMTATPIPRSMAMTVFGDLDLSILDELPKGRVEVETFLVNEDKRQSGYEWAKKQLRSSSKALMKGEAYDNEEKNISSLPSRSGSEGDEVVAADNLTPRKRITGGSNQMFVICPLIEESDNLQAKSAVTEFEKIKSEFSDFKVELLHGRMKEKDKNDILERFGRKEFDILVATPVIEVGIDIRDATIIMIESSERFGLAQLHQLRGRVGRSDKKSYCMLFSTNEVFPERLNFFAKTKLGIKLAEFDLENRGPGEVYGTRQTGIPKLKMANIMDLELVKKAREALEQF